LEAWSPARPLPVALWLAVPLLFTATALGLVGGASLLLGVGDGTEPVQAVVFGAAAAVTAALHSGVRWGRHGRLRRIALGYPAVVLAGGVALSGLTVPDLVGVAVGLPAAIIAVAACVWEHQLSSGHGA
jgi:hypothetical protein